MHAYRTHFCDAIRAEHVGQTVKLSGWVHRTRDHGQLVFIDLRDHYGVTQCVAESDHEAFEKLTHLRNESVVTIVGEVIKRDDEAINAELPTGDVEVKISEFHLESEADQLPMLVNNEEADFPEATRLKYRFLDMRRENLHKNIVMRAKIIQHLRWAMIQQDFTEVQTPILTASSPEGARDYLVPSRVHPGKFYALPQAPQMFKQLLMCSGFDKYFQIAPCFRDEDARADRSPGEFYQLDIEMAFATQEDVFAAIEPVMESTFKEFSDWEVTSAPFPRIPYAESMLKYGNDKPDLRNPIEIVDATDVWAGSGFGIFNKIIEGGGTIRAIPAPKTHDKPRSFFDKMIGFAQENGAKGLAYIIYDENGEGKGPIAKFLDADKHAALKEKAGLSNGDAIFFSSGSEEEAATIAGVVRTEIGEQLDLIEQGVFKFCWIVDFPFFEWNEDEKRIDFSHNPFSMPQGGLEVIEAAEGDNEKLLAIKAYQYDIVCNGVELSSGAIRNHRPDIMKKAFNIAGYDESILEEKFGALWRAFHFGAPPHGGIAPGVDRMVMLLANEPNIREVIAFPMNQRAEDLLMGAPSTVDEKQLKELNILLSPKARQALEDEKNGDSDIEAA
ncbi:MAG: aspartate--tRNA ligase [Rickettsiales bacterium]|nr:aspartate--tRNA ligase [Rickettsiales bacterium]